MNIYFDCYSAGGKREIYKLDISRFSFEILPFSGDVLIKISPALCSLVPPISVSIVFYSIYVSLDLPEGVKLEDAGEIV